MESFETARMNLFLFLALTRSHILGCRGVELRLSGASSVLFTAITPWPY